MKMLSSSLATRAIYQRIISVTRNISRVSALCSDKSPSDAATEALPKYIPRRACIYVPGSDEKKLRKIPTLDVDCAILDCEDGVAINKKAEARAIIPRILDELDFGRTEPVVRINSVESGLAEDDLKGVLQAQKLPSTFMLPKVEKPDHIEWFESKLIGTLKDLKRKNVPMDFKLIMFTESALGLLRLEEICQKAMELSELGTPVQLVGIVFGSDDYCASIGAQRTKNAVELLYARQKIVTIAKAYQLQAIDLVHIDYKDLDNLREQCLEGARMGFTGKQVIHPAQIPIVQESFSPSTSKLEWATELIRAFDEHQQSGKGAFTFRDQMIDMPTLRQAQNIVQLMQQLQPAAAPPTSTSTSHQPDSSSATSDQPKSSSPVSDQPKL